MVHHDIIVSCLPQRLLPPSAIHLLQQWKKCHQFHLLPVIMKAGKIGNLHQPETTTLIRNEGWFNLKVYKMWRKIILGDLESIFQGLITNVPLQCTFQQPRNSMHRTYYALQMDFGNDNLVSVHSRKIGQPGMLWQMIFLIGLWFWPYRFRHKDLRKIS